MHILNILLFAGVSYAAAASDSCTYRHPTHGVIDLASLGYQNGQARFRDVSPLAASSNMYSFNPCFSFTESACSNAAVCQLAKDRSYSQTIATQSSSTWTVDSFLTPTLTYTSASKTVAITMVCSMGSDDTLEILSSSSPTYVQMQLRSRCACWNQCTSPTTSPTTVSTATGRWWYSTPCMYRDSKLGTIDFTSVGRVSNGPAFEDIPSSYPNDYVWSYNPCYSFSEDQCDEVAGCQLDKSRGISYAIGMQNTADWTNMRSNGSQYPTIRYSAPGTNRRLSVRLVCDRSSSAHRLQVLGETAVGEYLMQLTSRCACWNECTNRPTPVDWNMWSIIGITAGAVIVLVLMMMTCLFCSKPKRRYRYMVLNEKSPLYT